MPEIVLWPCSVHTYMYIHTYIETLRIPTLYSTYTYITYDSGSALLVQRCVFFVRSAAASSQFGFALTPCDATRAAGHN